MNILFLIGVYPGIGGTERITSVLANRFIADGHKVWIASFRQSKLGLDEDKDKGINFIYLKERVICKNNIDILRSVIQNKKIDYIFNQWCLPLHTTWLCNKARSGTSCKLYSVLHGMPNNSKIIINQRDKIKNSKKYICRLLLKAKLKFIDTIIKKSCSYVYNHSDRYILLSPSFIPHFVKYASIDDNKKLCAIGNPLTIESDFDLNVLKNKNKNILYVGRIDLANKRVNRIVEAWEVIYKKYPDWSLTIVGDGPNRHQLMEYVNIKCIERVNFTGFIKEDPIDYYRSADILMLTSDLEGFGLVIIEGMSYGCIPIVYGSYSAVYDIIEDGISGFITSVPFSLQTTVNRMEQLINHPDIRNMMAKNAINRARKFSIDEVICKWYSLINKCN